MELSSRLFQIANNFRILIKKVNGSQLFFNLKVIKIIKIPLFFFSDKTRKKLIRDFLLETMITTKYDTIRLKINL